MTTDNLFEKAARLRLRFETSIGLLTVEDLWTLPLTSTSQKPNLDDIAVALHNRVKTDGVSFVNATRPDEATTLLFEIVKHIIAVRLEEKQQAEEAAARSERKQKLLGLIARKEDEKLEGLSVDELRKLVEGL